MVVGLSAVSEISATKVVVEIEVFDVLICVCCPSVFAEAVLVLLCDLAVRGSSWVPEEASGVSG